MSDPAPSGGSGQTGQQPALGNVSGTPRYTHWERHGAPGAQIDGWRILTGGRRPATTWPRQIARVFAAGHDGSPNVCFKMCATADQRSALMHPHRRRGDRIGDMGSHTPRPPPHAAQAQALRGSEAMNASGQTCEDAPSRCSQSNGPEGHGPCRPAATSNRGDRRATTAAPEWVSAD